MRRRYKGFKLKQLKIYIAKPDDNFKNAEEFDKARREEMLTTANRLPGERAHVTGDVVHHNVVSNQQIRETYELEKELLWRSREDFITFFKATPEELEATWESQVTPQGVKLEGWRTEMVDFEGCEAFRGKKPRSVIAVGVDYVASVGLEGRFGNSGDLANVAASAAAITENKLHVGQASSSAKMLEKKEKAEAKEAEEQAAAAEERKDGLRDEECNPRSCGNNAMSCVFQSQVVCAFVVAQRVELSYVKKKQKPGVKRHDHTPRPDPNARRDHG